MNELAELKSITQTELAGKLHVGQDDTPALSTLGMQQLMDAHPNANTNAINQHSTAQNANNALVGAAIKILENHAASGLNPHKVTKEQLGLGSCDNTSDTDKPVSEAQRAAIDAVKKYADSLALQAGAVISVFGRASAVAAQAGDYTADMVGARPDTWTPTAAEVGAYTKTETNALLANKADRLTAAKTIYVATTGSNSTGNGTQAKPFATVSKAISTLPKNLNEYNAVINIAAGSYGEVITILGFCNGVIDLNFAEGCTFWGLKVLSSSAMVRISGNPSFVYNVSGAYIIASGKKTIVYIENAVLILKSGGMTVTGTSDCTGISVSWKGNFGTYGSAFVIKVSGCYYGIAVSGSLAYFPTLQTKTANTIGVYCGGGGICAYASIPVGFGTTQYSTIGGGRIHAGAQTNVPNY